ncbi:MAG: hypothetical protein KJO05_00190 [Bacteroidia bacterium]|nr:hypothetical protein [Bacteroidia bacterium]NNF30879.1 hypothetical protein [Flavobacteriaceae bacterium]MBT8275415.1 hypothetical protein [Bacteroidia bacterium]NNJ82182.1 hypothetical protein [Flavobacteriaceae bacterium]NNK54492.1 hypothetical protein [Flavobacteriaceae bacterium]
MKTDLYTKSVLTVIAICLTVNLIGQLDLIPKAHASESNPSEVSTEYAVVPISDMETMDVRIVDINTYDELNVNLKSVDTYDEVKVNIKSIDTSDELDVNLDEIGGGWVTNGGPIKVKLD